MEATSTMDGPTALCSAQAGSGPCGDECADADGWRSAELQTLEKRKWTLRVLRAVGVCPLVVSCYRWFEQRTIFQAGKPEKNNHSFWGGTSQIITQKPYSKQ